MSNLPNYVIPALDYGYRWDKDIITFSIPVIGSQWNYIYSDEPISPNYAVLSTEQANIFRGIIGSWNELINLDIREVLEPNNIGDIRIAFTGSESGVGAWSNFPSNTARAGDVWLINTWKPIEFQSNDLISWLLSHELGHSLGLNHPFSPIDYDSQNEVFFTNEDYQYHLPKDKDNSYYTVMSYTKMDKKVIIKFDDNIFGEILPVAPMLYDIAAIQNIYGANYTTRSDNTTYSYHTESIKEPFYTTIWDGGGIDTIDTSLQTAPSFINLEEGEFSSIAYSTFDEIQAELFRVFSSGFSNTFISESKDRLYTGENNLAIAYGVTIENAIGGENNDTLLGNQANNQLTGRSGNDFINGKSGTDTAIYLGNYNQYSINLSENTNQIIISDLVGNDGIDTLENIEKLQFLDKVISVDEIKASFHIPTNRYEVVTHPNEDGLNKINYFLMEISSPLNTPVSVHYETRDGSAIAGQDYVKTTGTAIIAEGQTHVVIGVEIINDNISEEDESFSLVITQPSRGTFPEGVRELVVTHTIIDSDSVFQNSAKVIGVNEFDLDNIS